MRFGEMVADPTDEWKMTTLHEVDGIPFMVRAFESSADEFEVYREDGRSVFHYVHNLEGRHISVNTLVEPDEIVRAAFALADRLAELWEENA